MGELGEKESERGEWGKRVSDCGLINRERERERGGKCVSERG